MQIVQDSWRKRLLTALTLGSGAVMSGCVVYDPVVPVEGGYYAAPPTVYGYYQERYPARPYHHRHYRGRGGDYPGDRDDNPPGRRGGPGTNWENPPGPRGGPGASPDRHW